MALRRVCGVFLFLPPQNLYALCPWSSLTHSTRPTEPASPQSAPCDTDTKAGGKLWGAADRRKERNESSPLCLAGCCWRVKLGLHEDGELLDSEKACATNGSYELLLLDNTPPPTPTSVVCGGGSGRDPHWIWSLIPPLAQLSLQVSASAAW